MLFGAVVGRLNCTRILVTELTNQARIAVGCRRNTGELVAGDRTIASLIPRAEDFQYLPLGVRLWRGPDKGSKYDHADNARKVHKVFVTFSPRVAQMLRERKIKIDY